MSESNEPTQEQAANEPANSFENTDWQVLVGISGSEQGLQIGLASDASVMIETPSGMVADKAQPAVHFAAWLDRNKEHLVALWRTEYAQYQNLKQLERGLPGLRIVGADGSALN